MNSTTSGNAVKQQTNRPGDPGTQKASQSMCSRVGRGLTFLKTYGYFLEVGGAAVSAYLIPLISTFLLKGLRRNQRSNDD